MASGEERQPTSVALRFGPGGRLELQAHEPCLLDAGHAVALGARAFDLLLGLAHRPGQVLSKRDLIDLVWPNVLVEENNLAAQVSALRRVVGADLVATIPGRGYCFTAHPEA